MTIAQYAGDIVASLARAVFQGSHNLESIPGLLKRIIDEDLWREYPSGGEMVVFNNFGVFLQKGIRVEVRTLQNLCRDDPQALDLLDKMITNPNHRPVKEFSHNNVMTNGAEAVAVQGNAETYPLRRLRRSRPDLHQRVLDRELSPHAAMVEAGFRPKTITMPKDPERVSRLLRRHFSATEISQIISGLTVRD